MRNKFLVVLAVLFALVLSACGTSTANETSSTTQPSAAQPVEPVTPVTPPASDATPSNTILSFGETTTWDDNVSISISEPRTFTAGEYAVGVKPGVKQYVFQVVLTNGSNEVLEPSAYASMSSGGVESDPIFDVGNPLGAIGDSPTTVLLPGKTVKWLIGFSVLDPKDMTLQVRATYAHTAAIFSTEK